ncbi:MAG: RsmD family RNA methyltransferase [Bacteroidia bacterium]|nr:RsmD family RNA methyltransferase [Bacteroidia bacterium]MBP9689225.1 RsmD family RNA methyltransferase [Bacteroidia bacterium]
MRIISGDLRGILIAPPKGLPVRPTTDRAKESLFNIIDNNFNITDLNVLDIFSGTGNISYEFASRGAQKITAVDLNFKCTEFIKLMKQKHQLKNIDVVKKDAFTFLKSTLTTYDIIFADAPYAHKDIIQIPKLVAERKLLNPKGWLIVEHENVLDLDTEPNFLNKRVYGQSCFSFFSAAD